MLDTDTIADSAVQQQHEWVTIGRAAAGDVQAFEWLYRQHERRIYTLMLRMSADFAMAQDLTQELFVHVWQRLGQFRGDSKFSTWLHTVATRFATQYLRRQRPAHVSIVDSESCQQLQQQVSDSPVDLTLLDQLVARLPLQMRWVFVLHCLEGLSHQQIAAELGIAEGTSKAHLHHARQQLEEWLEHD